MTLSAMIGIISPMTWHYLRAQNPCVLLCMCMWVVRVWGWMGRNDYVSWILKEFDLKSANIYFLNTWVCILKVKAIIWAPCKCANLVEAKRGIISIIQSKWKTKWQPFRNWRPTHVETLPRLNNLLGKLRRLILTTETKTGDIKPVSPALYLVILLHFTHL